MVQLAEWELYIDQVRVNSGKTRYQIYSIHQPQVTMTSLDDRWEPEQARQNINISTLTPESCQASWHVLVEMRCSSSISGIRAQW
jgi:hypothetical protein